MKGVHIIHYNKKLLIVPYRDFIAYSIYMIDKQWLTISTDVQFY